MSTIYLVSCVRQKCTLPAPARDLYISTWFKKARAYVERTGARWYILSARYGLVCPESTIGPYEKTLNGMTVEERRHWAEGVARQVLDQVGPGDRVVFLAGRFYRERLASLLREAGVTVECPMEGLAIGQQLHWLGVHTKGRLEDLVRLYDLLGELEERLGGMRTLEQCTGRMPWPERGVYLFFEQSERRSESGNGPRVVRVGTHALTTKSKSRFWERLAQHRGVTSTGGGNHRGSIFRPLVGSALASRDGFDAPSWGIGSDIGAAARRLGVSRAKIKAQELPLERAVSRHIRSMHFLWLEVDDAAGPGSLRGVIERGIIALVSNYKRTILDGPSSGWLGRHATREKVSASGQWNSNHVAEDYDPIFLDSLEDLVLTCPLKTEAF